MADTNNVSRRNFLKATGGVAAASALPGYLDRETTRASSAAVQEGEGGTFQLINSTMTTLDPVASTDTASGVVIQQMFDSLTNYPNGEIEVEALLAADYETSDDFTTYTFTLKEGAQFHNGDEVTAQDFVYSFERLAASENSQRQYFILDSLGVAHETETTTTDEGDEVEEYVPGSLAIEANDDYTLTIELSEPFHSALEMLAYSSFAVVPEGLVDDLDDYDGEMSQGEFSNNPVGSGPFQFESYEAGTSADVTRFDDYHGEVASIDGVHWQIIEDDNAIFNYSMNQNSDLAGIPTAFYDPSLVSVEETDDLGRQIGTYGPVRNGETLQYTAVPTINSFYIGFNTANVEKPVRQAAAHVTDQQTLVEQVFKGRGAPAYHFTPPSIYPDGPEAYDSHAQENYPYGYNETQIEEARQVMEEAGYSDGNRYSFTLTTYEDQSWQQIAQLLRDQLASVYIDVEIEQAPFSTLIQRGLQGNLEAYTLGWIMDWPAPDNFLQLLNPPQTDTSEGDAIAYTNWSESEAASQAEEAWQQVADNPAPTDEAGQARNEAYVTMEEANWEDVVFLNIYHRVDERFAYPWVDIPTFGGAGTSRQKYNTVSLGDRP